MGLSFAELPIREISLLAQDGPAEVPQVDANLVGSSSDWPGLNERCAIGKLVKHAKFCTGGCALVSTARPQVRSCSFRSARRM